MYLIDTQIESKRLLLLPVNHDHAEEMFRTFTPEITRYMRPAPARAIGEILEFIEQAQREFANGTNLQLSVLEKSTGEFMGCAGLHNIGAADPELGIWIRRESHGHGYGREAIATVIEWARANIQFEHLRYPVDKRNIPSRKIAERNGGIVRKEYRRINQSGFELDEVEYWIAR